MPAFEETQQAEIHASGSRNGRFASVSATVLQTPGSDEVQHSRPASMRVAQPRESERPDIRLRRARSERAAVAGCVYARTPSLRSEVRHPRSAGASTPRNHSEMRRILVRHAGGSRGPFFAS